MIIERFEGEFKDLSAEELLRRDLPQWDDWPMLPETEEELRAKGIITDDNYPTNQEELRKLLQG